MNKNNLNGESIYLNRDLSDYFDFPYQNNGKQTKINANTLRHKNPEWDVEHIVIFDKYSGQDLNLIGTGYGWWEITN